MFASDATVDGDSQGYLQLLRLAFPHYYAVVWALARDPFATSFVVYSTLFPPPEFDVLY